MAIDMLIISFVFLSFLHKSTLLRSDNNVIRDEFQCIVKYFSYLYFYPEIECLRICVYLISFGCRVNLLTGSTLP